MLIYAMFSLMSRAGLVLQGSFSGIHDGLLCFFSSAFVPNRSGPFSRASVRRVGSLLVLVRASDYV